MPAPSKALMSMPASDWKMAEHTVNAHGDDRTSMLIIDSTGESDPLGQAQLTLVGRLVKLTEPGAIRDRYLELHPYAPYYADFTDFGFWRLNVEQCRFVGGFGHMSWVTAGGYGDALVDPLGHAGAHVVEHMNDDHSEVNLLYVQKLAGLDDATNAAMLGIDRYGVTLRADTPAGLRMALVPFGETLNDAE